MKAALFRVATIWVDCPYCGEGITAPMSQSYLFDDVEMAAIHATGDMVTCPECGKGSRVLTNPLLDSIPNRVKKAKIGQ